MHHRFEIGEKNAPMAAEEKANGLHEPTASGELIASGSYDNSIHLWNTSDGRHLRMLEAHTSIVNSVTVAPDGRTIASKEPISPNRLGGWGRDLCLDGYGRTSSTQMHPIPLLSHMRQSFISLVIVRGCELSLTKPALHRFQFNLKQCARNSSGSCT